MSHIGLLLHNLESADGKDKIKILHTLGVLLSSKDAMRIEFHKQHGVQIVLKYLEEEDWKLAGMAFHILEISVSQNLENKLALTADYVFQLILRILSRGTMNHKKSAVYLLASIVKGNVLGQGLVRESGCLLHLIQMFHDSVQATPLETEDSSDFLQFLCTAIKMCVQNPQNCQNQHQTSLIIPKAITIVDNWLHQAFNKYFGEHVQILVTMLVSIIMDNPTNQYSFYTYSGIKTVIRGLNVLESWQDAPSDIACVKEKLVMLLDAAVGNNTVNCEQAGLQGAVVLLLQILLKCPEEHKFSLLAALTHLVEGSENCKKAFLKENGITAVVVATVNLKEDSRAGIAANVLLKLCASTLLQENKPNQNESLTNFQSVHREHSSLPQSPRKENQSYLKHLNSKFTGEFQEQSNVNKKDTGMQGSDPFLTPYQQINNNKKSVVDLNRQSNVLEENTYLKNTVNQLVSEPQSGFHNRISHFPVEGLRNNTGGDYMVLERPQNTEKKTENDQKQNKIHTTIQSETNLHRSKIMETLHEDPLQSLSETVVNVPECNSGNDCNGVVSTLRNMHHRKTLYETRHPNINQNTIHCNNFRAGSYQQCNNEEINSYNGGAGTPRVQRDTQRQANQNNVNIIENVRYNNSFQLSRHPYCNNEGNGGAGTPSIQRDAQNQANQNNVNIFENISNSFQSSRYPQCSNEEVNNYNVGAGTLEDRRDVANQNGFQAKTQHPNIIESTKHNNSFQSSRCPQHNNEEINNYNGGAGTPRVQRDTQRQANQNNVKIIENISNSFQSSRYPQCSNEEGSNYNVGTGTLEEHRVAMNQTSFQAKKQHPKIVESTRHNNSFQSSRCPQHNNEEGSNYNVGTGTLDGHRVAMNQTSFQAKKQHPKIVESTRHNNSFQSSRCPQHNNEEGSNYNVGTGTLEEHRVAMNQTSFQAKKQHPKIIESTSHTNNLPSNSCQQFTRDTINNSHCTVGPSGYAHNTTELYERNVQQEARLSANNRADENKEAVSNTPLINYINPLASSTPKPEKEGEMIKTNCRCSAIDEYSFIEPSFSGNRLQNTTYKTQSCHCNTCKTNVHHQKTNKTPQGTNPHNNTEKELQFVVNSHQKQSQKQEINDNSRELDRGLTNKSNESEIFPTKENNTTITDAYRTENNVKSSSHSLQQFQDKYERINEPVMHISVTNVKNKNTDSSLNCSLDSTSSIRSLSTYLSESVKTNLSAAKNYLKDRFFKRDKQEVKSMQNSGWLTNDKQEMFNESSLQIISPQGDSIFISNTQEDHDNREMLTTANNTDVQEKSICHIPRHAMISETPTKKKCIYDPPDDNDDVSVSSVKKCIYEFDEPAPATSATSSKQKHVYNPSTDEITITSGLSSFNKHWVSDERTVNKMQKVVSQQGRRCPERYSRTELDNLVAGVSKYGLDFKAIRRAYAFHSKRTPRDLYLKWRKSFVKSYR